MVCPPARTGHKQHGIAREGRTARFKTSQPHSGLEAEKRARSRASCVGSRSGPACPESESSVFSRATGCHPWDGSGGDDMAVGKSGGGGRRQQRGAAPAGCGVW